MYKDDENVMMDYCYTRQDRLGNAITIEKFGTDFIVNNMVKSQLRWFSIQIIVQ